MSKTSLGSLGATEAPSHWDPLQTVWNMSHNDPTACRGCKKAGASIHQLILSLTERQFWNVNSQTH